MRLLLTRAEEDGRLTAKRLAGLGHEAVLCPAFDIVACEGAALPPGPFDGVVITSRNALRAARDLAGFEGLRQLPLYAVGQRTAETARQNGFTHIVHVASDVEALVACLASGHAGQRILYLRGKIVSRDIASELVISGPSVEEVVVYEALPRKQLTDEASRMLRHREIDGVLFYSAATARAFMAMMEAQGLAAGLGGVTAFCLSSEVGSTLPAGIFRTLRIASTPDEDALLALLPRLGAALDEEGSRRQHDERRGRG